MRISDWSSDVCSSDLLNAEFEVTPSIRLFSQSAYSKDFYSSTQDYNRFVSNSVFNDSSGLYQLNRKPVPTDGVSPGGVLTDPQLDRKSVVKGKSVSVRVDFGGRRIIKKKKKNK